MSNTDPSFALALAGVVSRERAVGALATQALMNPLYGPAGIELLAAGVTSAEVVSRLTDRAVEEGLVDEIVPVAGVEARGFIFGGALAARLNASFVPARKPGKLPAEVWILA